MSSRQVTILALDPALSDRAVELHARLTGEMAMSTSAALVMATSAHDAAIRSSHAVVVLTTRRSGRDLAALLDDLYEKGAPVLALSDDVPAGGDILVERLDAAPQAIAAVLRGMLHRERDVERLRGELDLASRCTGGLQVEIARMHEELQLATMVQREFLPRETPPVHDVHFGALWRPCGYVSGDIYDIMRLDEDHVGIFLADAVGHGVPAALLTMLICRSLPTREALGRSDRIIPPSEALARLNGDMIRRQTGTPRFATAVYAVLDCRRRVLTVAGAGHPPPMILRPDGSIRPVETEGGLLGIFPQEQFAQVEIPLESGETILFYSDGFEQAFPDADAETPGAASTRYLDEFRELATAGTAPDMIDRLRARLDGSLGSLHQCDDITLLGATACALGGAPLRTTFRGAVGLAR